VEHAGFARILSLGSQTKLSREGTAEVTFSVVAISQPSLFLSQPQISPDGTLTFEPAPSRAGTAHVIQQP